MIQITDLFGHLIFLCFTLVTSVHRTSALLVPHSHVSPPDDPAKGSVHFCLLAFLELSLVCVLQPSPATEIIYYFLLPCVICSLF